MVLLFASQFKKKVSFVSEGALNGNFRYVKLDFQHHLDEKTYSGKKVGFDLQEQSYKLIEVEKFDPS
jgi:hypothetical protein